MKKHYYFAIDLGATSGRTILGTITNGKVIQEEWSRFPNAIVKEGSHYYWDIDTLEGEIVKALARAAKENININSIGIDTWGVDFVVVGCDGKKIAKPWAYRDPCTMEAMDEYFEKVMPREKVYEKTGIQVMNFNSLFQLYAMQKERPVAHDETVLFTPDYLTYRLTGRKVCEYTIASTSQMLNPMTGDLDEDILASIGMSRGQFGIMTQPGTIVGTLSEEMQSLTGLGAVPVVSVAGHDTASAVAAVPARDKNFAYLSSGTWSLLGIESPTPIINKESYDNNFTNEGGIEHTTRFLKNICGMWLYERCRAEWKGQGDISHEHLLSEAMKCAPMRSIINPDDPRLANPENMTAAIKACCQEKGMPVPESREEICRCIFDSLAMRYKEIFSTIQDMASFQINTLHIIGGGSLNEHLNQLTANALNIEVKAGPQECTAIGNIMLQAKAAGEVADLWQMRRVISDSVEMKTFKPENNK